MKKNKGIETKVIQDTDKDKEIPIEIIAQSIKNISEGLDKINRSNLTKRAVLLLVADASKERKTTVNKVLNGIDSLKRLYFKA